MTHCKTTGKSKILVLLSAIPLPKVWPTSPLNTLDTSSFQKTVQILGEEESNWLLGKHTLRRSLKSGTSPIFSSRCMSLTTPHPLWTTAGGSPNNVCMAKCQAIMLSVRYRTQHCTALLTRQTFVNSYLTSLPDVIVSKQKEGQVIFHQLFGLTRIWCFSLHGDRLKLLNRLPNFTRY